MAASMSSCATTNWTPTTSFSTRTARRYLRCASTSSAQRRYRRAVRVEKEVVGVQFVVAQELIDAAMEIVRAGLSHHVHDRPGACAVLRRHVQRKFLEFLNDIGIGRGADAPAQPLVRAAVDQEPGEIRPQAVHYGAVAVFKVHAGDVHGARRELDQVEDVAAI